MTVETVCFVPCCSSKKAVGGMELPPYTWPGNDLEPAWTRLLAARQGMVQCVEVGSGLTLALYFYSGGFYKVFDVGLVKKFIYSGKLRLFIISAGYGILDAFESVHNYDAEMKGRVARYWRDAGLVDIIGDICLYLNPNQVYGFFAGEPVWTGPGAKYRYFFTEGVKKALRSGIKPARAGCFYRESGKGVTAILGSLGRVFSSYLTNSLTGDGMIEAAKLGGMREGSIVIGYDELMKGSQSQTQKIQSV